MNEVKDFFQIYLRGKKTYLIAATLAILGVLQATGVLVVPEWLWACLAAAGLSTLSACVKRET